MENDISEDAEKYYKYVSKLKKRYKCSIGGDTGYCDGTKNGSKFMCPERCGVTGSHDFVCMLYL